MPPSEAAGAVRVAGSTSADAPPFVSVVVPVYNDAVGIEATLAALLGQTYARGAYEVVVADNGSDDGGATVAAIERMRRHHSRRIRLVSEDGVRGSYAARNRGAGAARGSVLAFTDADCVPAPDWIEEGVRALERARAAFVGGCVEMTFEDEDPTAWEYFDAVGKLNQRRYIEVFGFGATANLFVRRGSFERAGGFLVELRSGGDYEFGRRLSRAGETGVYAEAAVVRHPARASARAILAKERRIALGHAQLDALGLFEHDRLSWRKLVPVRRCPPLGGVRARLRHRVVYVLMANVVRYYNLLVRLRARASGRTP